LQGRFGYPLLEHLKPRLTQFDGEVFAGDDVIVDKQDADLFRVLTWEGSNIAFTAVHVFA